jgi:hypothetical protein
MRSILIRCYPARWRARYGDEFEAVLEERPLGPFDVADILLAAFDAHLHLRGLGAASDRQRGFTMSLRLGGSAAILGAILFMTGFVVASIDDAVGVEALPGAALFLAGTVLLLLALVGLSAFQARRHPRLIWAAFAIPAIGLTMTGVGIVAMATRGDGPFLGSLSPWEIWILGVLGTVVGSGLFAIATYRTDALPRLGAGLLGAGSAVLLAVFVLGMGFAGIPEAMFPALILVGLLAFTAGWIALGWTAIRLDQPAAAARPA